MDTVGTGADKEVYLSKEEYRAYEIIKLGKQLGLPPQQIFKELKEEKLSGSAMRKGMSAYNMGREGATIYEGELHIGGYDYYH